MKKILFLSAFAMSSLGFAQEQVIVNENFNALTNGNIATDLTGATAGQNGWFIFGGTGASVANFQIVNIDVPHGKSAQLTTGNSYSATNNPNSRYLFKDISTTVATAANDIITCQLNFYTGPATGKGKIQTIIYDDTGKPYVGIAYDYDTKKIGGLGRLTKLSDATSGFYNVGLGAQTFPANTWVTVAFLYNKTSGALNYAYTDGTAANTFSGGFPTPPAGYSLEPGYESSEIDFVSSTATGNTVANTSAVDDLVLKFTNTALMGVNDVNAATIGKEVVSVYPNPTTDVLNIKTKDKIKALAVYDLSGKKMEVQLEGTAVNVKHLEAGAYIITIETNKTVDTVKFIKK